MGTKNFASARRNYEIWPKNSQMWPKIDISCPFGPMPNQETMRTKCIGGFPFFSRFCLLLQKLGFLAQNDQIWPRTCILGHFETNIGLSDPFGAMRDQ